MGACPRLHGQHLGGAPGSLLGTHTTLLVLFSPLLHLLCLDSLGLDMFKHLSSLLFLYPLIPCILSLGLGSKIHLLNCWVLLWAVVVLGKVIGKGELFSTLSVKILRHSKMMCYPWRAPAQPIIYLTPPGNIWQPCGSLMGLSLKGGALSQPAVGRIFV